MSEQLIYIYILLCISELYVRDSSVSCAILSARYFPCDSFCANTFCAILSGVSRLAA